MPRGRPTKPLVLPGDLPDTERVYEANPFLYEQRDPSYIPGHGEITMANDIATSKTLTEDEKRKYYARIGADPQPLPIEVCWVRIVSPGGGYSASADIDAAEYKRRGYKPLHEADLKAIGWDVPPAGHVEADGTIRREDTQLWYVDGDRARAQERLRVQGNLAVESPQPTQGKNTQVDIWAKEETREQITL